MIRVAMPVTMCRMTPRPSCAPSNVIYDVPEGRPIFIAVVLWLAASGLFALYVANFSHYNKIYGSLAGIIVFLIWMWISNVAIVLDAEFNAELERGRAMAAGHPADQEPFSELRDDRKLRKKEKRRSRS
jgi:membrane protein